MPNRETAARGAIGCTTGSSAVLVAVLLLFPAATKTRGQERERAALRLGDRVVAKSDALVLHDGRLTYTVRGSVFRVRTAGDPLLLQVEGTATTGRAAAHLVIPYDQGAEYFSRRIRANPRDSNAYLMRAICSLDKNTDRAVADLRQAAELDPENASVYQVRAEARWLRGEYDAAIDDCNRTIRRDPENATAYSTRGKARSSRNDFDGAIADLSRAIKLRPDNPRFYSNRGIAWSKAGDDRKAILDMTTAIRLEPGDVREYRNRANVWVHMGRYDWRWSTTTGPFGSIRTTPSSTKSEATPDSS